MDLAYCSYELSPTRFMTACFYETIFTSLCCQLLHALVAVSLLLTGMAVAEIETPVDVEENLIRFLPEIYLDSGKECQGVRVADRLIATSPECSGAISERLEEKTIRGIDFTGSSIGVIDRGSNNQGSSEPDILLSLSDSTPVNLISILLYIIREPYQIRLMLIFSVMEKK